MTVCRLCISQPGFITSDFKTEKKKNKQTNKQTKPENLTGPAPVYRIYDRGLKHEKSPEIFQSSHS